MAKCIVPGCQNFAKHNFGVRLRRPSTRAIWAPNTDAFICDDHATEGLEIDVILKPNATGRIRTNVSSPGGRVISRTTPIIHSA